MALPPDPMVDSSRYASGRKTSSKGPGRPEGPSTVREQVLDAAEAIFADLGYAGTTLREIAAKANVTQALTNYYFGSKLGLFEEVFLRRGQLISNQRIANLEELEARDRPPTVREIVEAFLTPTLALRASKEGRAFLRLQARLHTEPPQISYKVRREAYDYSTRRYVQVLRAALPDMSAKDAYWRMTLMIGGYLYIFSDTHRLEELAPGVCDTENSDEIIAQITTFVVAGFEAKA